MMKYILEPIDLDTPKPLSLLRLPLVMARTGLSKTEVYRRIKKGCFPPQQRISHKVSVWRADEVENWIESVWRGDRVATHPR